MNQPGNSLCLGQIQPTMHKSSVGKFSGLCQSHAGREKKVENNADRLPPSVTMNFYYIFTGVTPGRSHIDEHHLIDMPPPAVFKVTMIKVMRFVIRRTTAGLEKSTGCFFRIRSG